MIDAVFWNDVTPIVFSILQNDNVEMKLKLAEYRRLDILNLNI